MSGHLILAAYWSEDGDTDALADQIVPLKQKGTRAIVVNFDADHPQMAGLLHDLRRFDMDEVANSRPAPVQPNAGSTAANPGDQREPPNPEPARAPDGGSR